ncbi:DUF2798 domain-containing protein [Vibrio astriarenae]
MNELTMLSPSSETPNKTPILYKVTLIAGMMTLIGGTLTGAMTYMNLGYSSTFFSEWGSAFITTALVMMPIGFALMTAMTTLANRYLAGVSENKRNLLVGITMAVIMESIMAFTTTVNNMGWVGNTDFTAQWGQSLLTALPIGLVLMMTISMTIKPKIEHFLRS